LHFLQYLVLGFPDSARLEDCCKLKIGLLNSELVSAIASPLSSSTVADLQFGGTLPGSVRTTEK